MSKQAIVEFDQDEEGHWLVILSCGHSQHVRHDPPWQNRPWTQTEAGRDRMRGYPLYCRLCDDAQVDSE